MAMNCRSLHHIFSFRTTLNGLHIPHVLLHEKGGKGNYINMQRFRGGLVFKAHILCVSLNSRLDSNKEEADSGGAVGRDQGLGFGVQAQRCSGLGFRVSGVVFTV